MKTVNKDVREPNYGKHEKSNEEMKGTKPAWDDREHQQTIRLNNPVHPKPGDSAFLPMLTYLLSVLSTKEGQ